MGLRETVEREVRSGGRDRAPRWAPRSRRAAGPPSARRRGDRAKSRMRCSYGGPWGSESLRALVAAQRRVAGRHAAPRPERRDDERLRGGPRPRRRRRCSRQTTSCWSRSSPIRERSRSSACRGATVVPVATRPGRPRRRGARADPRRTGEPSDASRMIYTIASCQSPTGTILDRSRRVPARPGSPGSATWSLIKDDTYGESSTATSRSAASHRAGA